jgi:hypothetical protein
LSSAKVLLQFEGIADTAPAGGFLPGTWQPVNGLGY